MIGTALLIVVVLGTLGGCLFAWPLAIAYWSQAGRLVPWTPRRHVPWSFVDLLVVILIACTLLVGMVTAIQQARALGGNGAGAKLHEQYLSTIADSGWKIATMMVAGVYLVAKASAKWQDFGIALRDLPRQVAIGVMAFVMIAPPVHALQVAIVLLGKWKYEHPLIDMIQKSPDPLLFVLLTFTACIMAPLSEEWLFRVLLQGWLERAFAWLAGFVDVSRMPPAPTNPVTAAPPVEPASEMPAAGDLVIPAALAGSAAAKNDFNLYAASAAAAPERSPWLPEDRDAREEPFPKSVLVHWPPILISAVLFGLAHWGHGPAPITLTVLAIGLGYVYQRTHSIVAPMVVHALFNSFSMLIFYVFVFELKLPIQ